MGACCGQQTFSRPEIYIKNKLVSLIERDRGHQLISFVSACRISKNSSKKRKFDLNQTITHIDKLELNALALSLYLGSSSCFSVLINLPTVDRRFLTQAFTSIHARPVDIICKRGYYDILQLYLPLCYPTGLATEESTLNATQTEALSEYESPIQAACKHGYLNIVRFLSDAFSVYKTNEFNVHLINELYGENCALIACRTGNLKMIKFLHEECKANFNVFNKRNEGPLQLLAIASRKYQILVYNAFKYLVDTVKVNILHEHEEILVLLEDELVIEFFEEKLFDIGVAISKKDIEFMSMNSIVKQEEPNCEESKEINKSGSVNSLSSIMIEEESYRSNL